MADEIVKFDPATFTDKIRDRIKSAFVDLIPDDQWNEMVKQEIDGFVNGRLHTSGYHRGERDYPGLKAAIHEALTKAAKERIAAVIASEEWGGGTDARAKTINDGVARLISENASAILMNVLGNTFASVVQGMTWQLKQEIKTEIRNGT